jgi:hypothetical protein
MCARKPIFKGNTSIYSNARQEKSIPPIGENAKLVLKRQSINSMRNHGKGTALSIDAVKRYQHGPPVTRVNDHNAMHWSTTQSSKH